MLALRLHIGEQLRKREASARTRDDDASIARCLHIDAGAFGQADPGGDVFGQAQAEAIAPFCNLNAYRHLSNRRYFVYSLYILSIYVRARPAVRPLHSYLLGHLAAFEGGQDRASPHSWV